MPMKLGACSSDPPVPLPFRCFGERTRGAAATSPAALFTPLRLACTPAGVVHVCRRRCVTPTPCARAASSVRGQPRGLRARSRSQTRLSPAAPYHRQLTALSALRQAAMASAARPRTVDNSALVAAPVWAGSRAHAALVQVMRLMPMDDRARAACVCSTWRDAAADPSLWLALRFDGCSAKLNDESLARLCARAGAALRELRLNSPACGAVTTAGVVAALNAGGCAGVQSLMFPKPGPKENENHLTAGQAQLLAAACPALKRCAFCIRCESPEDVATACALPGPLRLEVRRSLEAARAALRLPVGVAALSIIGVLDAMRVPPLREALPTNASLKTLTLTGSGIGAAGGVALGEALLTNATLTNLTLLGNDTGAGGAVALGEALRTNATLATLKLLAERVGDAGATALGGMLRTNTTLTTLFLSSNNLGDAAGASLGEALRTNATLTALNLRSNRFGAAGAASLGAALRTNATLKTLKLSSNRFGAAGAAALGDALRTNAALTALELDWTNVGDAGAAALAEALRSNSALKLLSLEDNSIGAAGATALGQALRANATLVNLKLGRNSINDAGAAALGEALLTNTTLKLLQIKHNAVGDAGAAALGAALRTNATLTALMLGLNEVGDAGAAALTDALRANTTLKTLRLKGANIVGRG